MAKLDHYVQMEEVSNCEVIEGIGLTLISRRYVVEGTSSYSDQRLSGRPRTWT